MPPTNSDSDRLHDSGERRTFSTGAVRDAAFSKPPLELISPFFLLYSAIDSDWNNSTSDIRGTAIITRKALLEWHASGDICDFHYAIIKARHFYPNRLALETDLAFHLQRGASKYDARNWEKGIPISVSYASCRRHLDALIYPAPDLPVAPPGVIETPDTHRAAVICNLMFIYHTLVCVERGSLPASLLDLPHYSAKAAPETPNG
jgi:hypothetical protein